MTCLSLNVQMALTVTLSKSTRVTLLFTSLLICMCLCSTVSLQSEGARHLHINGPSCRWRPVPQHKVQSLCSHRPPRDCAALPRGSGNGNEAQNITPFTRRPSGLIQASCWKTHYWLETPPAAPLGGKKQFRGGKIKKINEEKHWSSFVPIPQDDIHVQASAPGQIDVKS